MSDIPSPERDPRTIARVKRDAARRLLAIPGVAMVGIGQKVIGDRHTGEPAIKVFVRDKRPLAELPAEEIIPARIDGVLTDVELGGDPVPDVAPVDQPGTFGPLVAPNTSVYDNTTYRPVVGGGQVTTFGSETHGTGGCLLWEPGNHDAGYVLTNMHVLHPPELTTVTKGVTRVGQPVGKEKNSKCCTDAIGTFAGGGLGDERDEAVVKLSPGMKWKPQIVDIGMVAGKHTLTQADVTVAGSPYKVAKRGMRSRVTGGTVTALEATANEVDNVIVIKPNPRPDPSGIKLVWFTVEGDSGSAVVNAANEVVGLHWGHDSKGNGIAYHIDHVLNRLGAAPDNLTLEVAHTTNPNEVRTVPGGTFTEVPPEVAARLAADPAERAAFTGTGTRAPVAAPWFADSAVRTVSSVRDDLLATARGRQLLDLWRAHGDEILALIGYDRRVRLAWHRGGGAALMQLLLRLSAHPDRPLPETLDGRPLMDSVDGLVAAFARDGSPELRAALERARPLLPDLAGRTYGQILTTLGAG